MSDWSRGFARRQTQEIPARCPRCGGNMLRHSDYYGTYASCLQCGKSLDVENRRKASELEDLAIEWQSGKGGRRKRTRRI